MFKKLLTAMMALTVAASAAAGAVQYGSQETLSVCGEDESLSVTGIVFRDEAGNPTGVIEGGKKLTASVKVKNEGTGDKTAIFYLNLYKTNRVVLSDSMEKVIPEGETVTLDGELDIPGETENMSVAALLWNNSDDMMPLASSGMLPLKDAGLRRITLNGNPLDGFSPEVFEYEVEYNEAVAPTVTAAALDGATLVNVIKPVFLSGKSIIELYLSNGLKKEYSIKYKNDASFAANPSSEATPQNVPVFNGKLSEGGQCASDRTNMTYSYVSDELSGKDHFICPMSWATLSRLKKIWNGTQSGSLAMFSFELTRSAVVRVVCEGECTVEGSFTEADGWKKTVAENPYLVRTYNGAEYPAEVMYEKEFTVTPGETLKADIPNHGGAAAYTVIMDYIFDSI